MIITEQMVCPTCLDKARKIIKGVSTLDTTRAEYTLTRHTWATVGRSERKLVEKLYRDEWLLFLKTIGEPRVWTFPSNPTEGPTTSEYIGHYATRLMNYDGILKSAQHMNPNDHFRSNLAILAQGVGRLHKSMVDRAEVLLLSPQRGSLSYNIVLTQGEPLSRTYKSEPISQFIGEYPYSLHKHSWSGGEHYDLRIQWPTKIDEWSTGVNPFEAPAQSGIVALRKVCLDPSLMSFSGEHTIEGIKTNAELLKQGTVTVTQYGDLILSFTLQDTTQKYRLATVDSQWRLYRDE